MSPIPLPLAAESEHLALSSCHYVRRERFLVFKGYAIESTKTYTDFKVIEFEPKRFEDLDVDIAVHCCGICSADVHTLTGGWGEPSVLPLIAGHEVAGKVVRVGKDVTEFKVGDRAGVGAQVGACYHCVPCTTDNEQYCPEQVDTYNSRYSNNDIAHGGYSAAIRVHERFVFALPDALADEDAASMLCGGLTVYSPMVRFGVGKGTKFGLVGLGGLGHYAVQFAKALGAEVTVFSHQADKESDARAMGAAEFVLTTSKDFAKPFAMYFDFILSTVDDVAGIPLTEFVSMLVVNGRYHQCGLPDKALPQLKAQDLMSNGAEISTNHIGSKVEANAMLKLAVEKGVTTWKQVLPMKDVAKGIEMVRDNTVRYRVILKQDLVV